MIYWQSAFIFLLILLNGFFSMAELAIVSSRRGRLQQLAADGSTGARAALELMEDPTRFLSTVQIGITLLGIITGAYGGATLAEPLAEILAQVPLLTAHAEGLAFVTVVAAIGYLSLVFGELVPKRLALHHSEAIAQRVALFMRLSARMAAPVVWVLSTSTDFLVRVFRLQKQQEERVTEEEVKALIEEGTQTGVFEPAERQMIDGVLRLADRPVRAVMTPRRDVVWLDVSDPPEEVKRQIVESGFSRFPVARGVLDEFLGVVDTKDLLDKLLSGKPFDLGTTLKRSLVVHETTRVMRLLDLFRDSPLHMAVVVDEYGTPQGIVTLTDVMASVAGEVAEPGLAQEELVQRPDGSWLVGGGVSIDEVERTLGIRGMGSEDYHTLAGFVLDRLQAVPQVAQAFDWNGWRFEVVDMDGPRVDKVLICRT